MNQSSIRLAASVVLALGLLHCSGDGASGNDPAGGAGATAVAGFGAAGRGPVTNSGGAGAAGSPAASAGSGGASGSSAGATDAGGAPPASGGTAGMSGLGGVSSGGAASGGTSGGGAASGGSYGSGGAPLFAPCPPAGTKCVIMPLGDSITEGYNSSTGGGYRLRLLHDIWAANHDATFVGNSSDGPSTLDGKPFPRSNEGHSGYTIDPAPAVNRSGISPLVAASLKKHMPHIVTLMIGTNDIGTNNDVANAPTRLGNLIDIITSTSPSALLVVAQITPPGDKSGNSRAQAYNAAIPDLVKTRVAAGKHIIVVDMYTPFVAHPDYMNGLHPNDTGYDFMGDTWYKALTPFL